MIVLKGQQTLRIARCWNGLPFCTEGRGPGCGAGRSPAEDEETLGFRQDLRDAHPAFSTELSLAPRRGDSDRERLIIQGGGSHPRDGEAEPGRGQPVATASRYVKTSGASAVTSCRLGLRDLVLSESPHSRHSSAERPNMRASAATACLPARRSLATSRRSLAVPTHAGSLMAENRTTSRSASSSPRTGRPSHSTTVKRRQVSTAATPRKSRG
jgi:hypothetical protein